MIGMPPSAIGRASRVLLPCLLGWAVTGCGEAGPGGPAAGPGTAGDGPAVKAAPSATMLDYNVDGSEDLLWWNEATGQLVAWHLQRGALIGTSDQGTSDLRPFSVRSRIVRGSGFATGARSASRTDSLSLPGCAEHVVRSGSALEIRIRQIPGLPACTGLATHRHEAAGWTLVDSEGRYSTTATDGTQVLWRNAVGTVAIWDLNTSGAIVRAGFPATAPLEWSIVDARGDYDGDGESDVLWRNTAGTVAMWRMQAVDRVAGVAFFGTAPPDSWTLTEAAGDYNNDGRTDLLWVDAGGNVVIWSLSFATQRFASTRVGSVPAGYRVLDGAVDLDDDGRSDIVWQGPGGDVVVWFMTGTGSTFSIKSSRVLTTLPPQWRLVSRNAR